jgi:enoyl-CoA hydratase
VTEYETLEVTRDGHVGWLVFDRPKAGNAMDATMLAELEHAWQELDADPEVRVIIVTGAGGHFCAGADLKAMAAGHPDDEWTPRFNADPDLHWKALLRHFQPRQPLIAAVEGFAVAGGTEILQAMDLRVAGQSAVFGIAEVRRGLFPLGGSTVRLRRQIPYTIAAELLLTGRQVTATEAKDIGLIGHVVKDGQALTKAKDLADQIAANGPLAVQAVLKSLRDSANMGEQEALAHELELGWPIFATKDAHEGPRAFAEKREPKFTGT